MVEFVLNFNSCNFFWGHKYFSKICRKNRSLFEGTNWPLNHFWTGHFKFYCGIGALARPGSNPDCLTSNICSHALGSEISFFGIGSWPNKSMILFAGTSRFKNKSTLERVNPKKQRRWILPLMGSGYNLFRLFIGILMAWIFIFDKLGEHYTFICSLATKFLKKKTYMNHWIAF